MPTDHSPSPFPFFSHPLLLIQAVYSGGVVSELRALQQPGLGQQTTHAAPPRSECGRSHRPPVRGETSGTWIRPPSGVWEQQATRVDETQRARKERAH
eukprot:scaffold2651_cov118-Isochrysis_galbana.AAC.3